MSGQSHSPPYALRPTLPSDRVWLWRTKRECMREYVEQTWGTWDEVAQRERFDTDFDPAEIRVITTGGRDAGYVSARANAGEFRLLNIMIAPGFQQRGVGTAVLKQLQDEARAHGVPLRLQVLKVNPAYYLYERLGFTVAEETPTHFRLQWLPK